MRIFARHRLCAWLLAMLLNTLLAPILNAQEYVGELRLKVLADGRYMETLADFSFVDGLKRIWRVPTGYATNGASIPSALWSFVGGPFSGKYRSAAVIHDYYCEQQKRPWPQVHRMFYDAMLASGVASKQALLMYLAVYRFGPRWDFEVADCRPGMVCDKITTFKVEYFVPNFDQDEFGEIRKKIERADSIDVNAIKKDLDRRFEVEVYGAVSK